jgi:SPP1 gp7 family putative phage head morphogenesis protein
MIPGPKIREAAASLGISFDAIDHEAFNWIRDNSAENVKNIDDTTRNRIQDILTQGTADKLSYSSIAQNIRDEFTQMATPAPHQHIRDRAELIAVTETRKAHEYSQALTRQKIRNDGWIIQKSWMITDDSRVCEICQDNADEGWIDDEDEYPSGDLYPPAHPACRCCTLTQNMGKQPQPEEQSTIEEEPAVIQVAPSAYMVTTPGEQSRAVNPRAAVMGITQFLKWLLPNIENTPVLTPSIPEVPEYIDYKPEYQKSPIVLAPNTQYKKKLIQIKKK